MAPHCRRVLTDNISAAVAFFSLGGVGGVSSPAPLRARINAARDVLPLSIFTSAMLRIGVAEAMREDCRSLTELRAVLGARVRFLGVRVCLGGVVTGGVGEGEGSSVRGESE